MAHSLQVEQRKGEMREGIFDWKVERFLENNKERKSDVFKFGRHDAFLKLSAKSADKSASHFSAYKNTSRKIWSNFNIELHITELLGIHVFSNITHYKACFVTCAGGEFFAKDGSIHQEESCYHVMDTNEGWMDGKRAELLPDGTLTFRLAWYESKNKIGPMKIYQETQTPSDLIPEKGPTKLLQALSEDFARLYENKTDTDCVLRVGDVQIPVHRTVLTARSEVFAAMFHHDTSENRSGVVDIPDVDPTILSDVLRYIYSGQIHEVSADNAAPMYIMADKYAMMELRDACLDVLKCNLTVENVCDAALLAHTHGETELETKVVQFMGDKLVEVEETDGWKQLSCDKPSLAIKLIRSAFMSCKEENKKLSSK